MLIFSSILCCCLFISFVFYYRSVIISVVVFRSFFRDIVIIGKVLIVFLRFFCIFFIVRFDVCCQIIIDCCGCYLSIAIEVTFCLINIFIIILHFVTIMLHYYNSVSIYELVMLVYFTFHYIFMYF